MRLSLRTRLFLMIVLPLVVVASLASWARYHSATRLSEQLYDHTLLAVALAISRDVVLSEGDILAGELLTSLTNALGDEVFYRIIGPDGGFVTGYSEAPAPPALTEADGPRFYDSRADGRDLRVVALREYFAEPQFRGWVTVQVWQTVTERAALSLRLLAQTMLILASVVLTAGLFVWFGIHRGLRPMRQIEHAIAVRSPDDLRPIRRWVPPELNTLVTATNGLLAQLRQAFDIRDAFISDAAHQMRNPVAAIQAQAEAALTATDEPTLRRRATEVALSANRLGRLTNQLLSMERVRGRQLRRRHELIDVAALVEGRLRDFAAPAMRAGVEVSFECHGLPRPLLADAVLIEELLTNLLDNAMIYGTPSRGEILVSLDFRAAEVVLTVQDDGPGIALEMTDRIFDRFFRIDDHGTHGCGLGLAIVRDVAQAHGGSAELIPTTQGARFEITFPQTA